MKDIAHQLDRQLTRATTPTSCNCRHVNKKNNKKIARGQCPTVWRRGLLALLGAQSFLLGQSRRPSGHARPAHELADARHRRGRVALVLHQVPLQCGGANFALWQRRRKRVGQLLQRATAAAPMQAAALQARRSGDRRTLLVSRTVLPVVVVVVW